MLKTNKKGIDLIIKYEGGFKLESYLCPAGVWTISAGVTFYENGNLVQQGDKITVERAVQLFENTLKSFEIALDKILNGINLTDNQYAAIVSFVYNVGTGNFVKSTLLKKLRAGDYEGAANEFLRWNKSGGKFLNGLTKRRNEERALFLS